MSATMSTERTVGRAPAPRRSCSPHRRAFKCPQERASQVATSAIRRFGELHLQELVISAVALALILFFTLQSPNFLTGGNASALASFIAPIAFFALAEVPILILGEIDLSVGEVYVLSPFLVEHFDNAGVPLPVSIVLTLAVCAAIGWINGLVTVKLHLPSFIATLGMTFALEGIILIGSNGAPANPVGEGVLVQVLGGGEW